MDGHTKGIIAVVLMFAMIIIPAVVFCHLMGREIRSWGDPPRPTKPPSKPTGE
jgi:hypothetical protein